MFTISASRKAPAARNWVIVREKSGGEQAGGGALAHPGEPFEAATELPMMACAGVEGIPLFCSVSPPLWRTAMLVQPAANAELMSRAESMQDLHISGKPTP